MVLWLSCDKEDVDYDICPDKNHPHIIDLGLPSGTKWSCCNVGANSPDEYGSYFAWGETSPKDSYDWSNYKWCNGDFHMLTKYCIESGYGPYGPFDYKNVLDLTDDAAYVNCGSMWRMPSREQQDELRSECNWQWTSMNGVNGYLVSSKRSDASLFLPAAGRYFEDLLYYDGSYVHYWSRTLDVEDPSRAYYLGFDSSNVGWGNGSRDYGQSVRAVFFSQQ